MPSRPATAPEQQLPRRLEYVRLDEVLYAARNPKGHDPRILGSIGHHGFVEVPAVDARTGRLVAGHGRHEKLTEMHAAGQDPPDGVIVDDDGMWRMPVVVGWSSRSDPDAEAYLIGSNQLTTAGGWDDPALLLMLDDLRAQDMLDLTGFDVDLMEEMRRATENPFTGDGTGTGEGEGDGNDDATEVGTGELLDLAGVTVGEPDITTERGQVWELGRHLLVVADVHDGWQQWTGLLTEGALFWPYPTLLAPFAKQAVERPVVMVQPNTYLAGWLLTKWARITGEDPGLRVGPAT